VKSGSRVKLPSRLTIGVESQNSLTKSQSLEWLAHWKGGPAIEINFRMLPMDLMIQALEADALDAIIAPSPWGMHAEAAGLGRRDPRFVPGRFAQQLVMVCHKDIHERNPNLTHIVSHHIAAARTQLTDVSAFRRAIAKMSGSGKPLVRSGILEQAASLHAFPTLNQDSIPDIRKLVEELMSLEDAAALPAQVSPSEQTARLLLPN
jgi:ABC-type nitrate/sulfonate/bicarbonate transport system substrate-binding protein